MGMDMDMDMRCRTLVARSAIGVAAPAARVLAREAC